MTFTRGIFTRLAIGAAFTTLFSFLLAAPPYPLQLLENKLLDIRFRLRGDIPVPDGVVVAAIDEKSLESLGRWPWDRDVIAALVDKLTTAEASVIAFDILLPEAEEHDTALAAAIDAAGNVLLPVVFDFVRDLPPTAANPPLEASALRKVSHAEKFAEYAPISANHVIAPVPELAASAAGIGQINIFPDRDGVLRWETLLVDYQGRLFPSLALLAATAHRGIATEMVIVDATRSIRLGSSTIPTDPFGRMLINYRGGSGASPVYSISDILFGVIPAEKLANRIVLIGATAVGIYDLRVTPLAAALPGVEKHAAVIASILDDRYLYAAPLRTNLLVLILSAAILTLTLCRTRALSSFFTASSLGAVIAIGGQAAFVSAGCWLNLSLPLLNIVCIYSAIAVYSHRADEKQGRNIRQLFSSYVTARVVNELIRNPEMAKLGGERREVTILFSDVCGFTTFSEQHSPTEVVATLNEYLGAMTDVIFRWEGTLDKFVGDEIMVFWGAPLPQADHALRALGCALDMRKALEDLHRKWEREGKPLLEAGVGINSGEVLVGNIGAQGKKMDYTVIGDHVNLGARVEGLTRKFNCSILLTEYTVELLRPAVDDGTLRGVALTGIDRVVVKGKANAVGLYSPTLLAPTAPARIDAVPEGREVVVMTEK